MTVPARWQALFLVVLIAAATEVPLGRVGAASDKTIFVAALDPAGKPVKGLTAADFALREDGVDREITDVKPATQPLQIVLLADTSKGVDDILQDMRRSLTAFVRQVHASSPDASIRVMEFGQAAVAVTPFSTSTEDLEKAVGRIAGKPGAASVLLEALVRASGDLEKRPSARRAIVSVNLEPNDEQSREEPKKIIEALRRSVAQVWSVSYQRGTAKNPQRDLVLNTLTKNTGGRREFIVGVSAIETILKDYADALTSQYEVIYKRPEGKAQVVQVGIRREGVKLYASGFAPQ
jgi:VWFA-related protein